MSTSSIALAEVPAFARSFDAGTILLDRYQIEAVIGQGAMGLVYRAQHVQTGTTVAVKVEHRDPDQLFFGRFEREASLMARVHHPNVASLLDFGRLPDGGGVLVLEYVDGESLDRMLQRCGGSLPWQEATTVALGMIEGLQAVHAAGVLHRDVKPSNVMLERTEPARVKLVDFGVARKFAGTSEDLHLTAAGEVLGTLNYMSPEQMLGQRIDARSDQYAIGVVLYEMLTGRLPFDERTMKGTVDKSSGQPPRTMVVPNDREPWPDHVEHAVHRALSFMPDERFDAVEEFAELLQRALAEVMGPGEPRHKSGTNLVPLEGPTRSMRVKEQHRRVAVIATRLPPGTLQNELERAWISDVLQGYARPVELGEDTIGIVLNEGGTGSSANIAAALVAALSARYGKLNVVQERVAVRDGWAIDVFSLVSVSTSLLEKLAERA
jgi:serine/threonine protein kinase